MAKLRAPLPAFARRPADYSVSSTDRTDDVPAPLALLRRFDTCLASCLTSSISTQSGKLDGKEAFGRHELVVLKMQSLPSGGIAILVIALFRVACVGPNLSYCVNKFRKVRLKRSFELSLHFA